MKSEAVIISCNKRAIMNQGFTYHLWTPCITKTFFYTSLGLGLSSADSYSLAIPLPSEPPVWLGDIPQDSLHKAISPLSTGSANTLTGKYCM